MSGLRPRLALALACLLETTLAAPAQAKGPTLDHLYPAGGPRGSTVQVEATGQFERWPVRAWSSGPSIEVEPGAEKGRLSVTIAADSPAGLHWIRLYDDEGATAPRPFLVGLLPEANEVEPNDDPSTARPVDPRGETINGRLGKTGDVDGFRVPLKKGQTLVAALEANHRLGSPMDGVLQVASAAGFVLAQVDDAPGRDPRVAFEAPTDGDYLVRAFAFPFVQESSIRFAGSPSYVYRLTLTTGGYADHAFPLAVARGGPAEVEAVGWNVPESARRLRVEAADGPGPVAVEAPGLAGPVEVQVVEGPSLVEVEPNDRAHPQAIPIPSAISGRVDRPGDVDAFAFAAKKGQVIAFQLDSRSLGLPLDAVLRVGDASGSTLVEVDDEGKDVDPALKFTAPSDGTFRLTIRDLNGQGGPRLPPDRRAAPGRLRPGPEGRPTRPRPWPAAGGGGRHRATRRLRRADRGRPRRAVRGRDGRAGRLEEGRADGHLGHAQAPRPEADPPRAGSDRRGRRRRPPQARHRDGGRVVGPDRLRLALAREAPARAARPLAEVRRLSRANSGLLQPAEQGQVRFGGFPRPGHRAEHSGLAKFAGPDRRPSADPVQ